MGQASQRGSYEERVAQAVARRKEQDIAREQAEAIRQANMTPEDRKRQRQVRSFIALATGLSSGFYR